MTGRRPGALVRASSTGSRRPKAGLLAALLAVLLPPRGRAACWWCPPCPRRLVVPDGVASVSSWQFAHCKERMRRVTLPSSLISIGDYAFADCYSLRKVVMSGHVASIGDCAFCRCENLRSIEIPDSLTSIGSQAFYGCHRLPSIAIPNSTTSIGARAFAHCSSLSSVAIPGNVTSIGEGTFNGCLSLLSIAIPDSVTSIGDRAFEGCSSLASVAIPGSVTFMGEGAFQGCSSLASVAIPGSSPMTSISDWTFSGCSSLASIAIPGSVTSIGDWAFHGCSLATIAIPGSVTSIGDRAFFLCTSLLSVVVPGSVTSVGDEAFMGCTSLASVQVLGSATSLGRRAFADCRSLAVATVPPVASVCSTAFSGSENLAAVTVTESVTAIPVGAFEGCVGLRSVLIPGSVSSIGARAFSGCAALEAVRIPNSVVSIGDCAFCGCRALQPVRIPGSISSFSAYSCSKYQGVDGALFYPEESLAQSLAEPMVRCQKCPASLGQQFLTAALAVICLAMLLGGGWAVIRMEPGSTRLMAGVAARAAFLSAVQTIRLLAADLPWPRALSFVLGALQHLTLESARPECSARFGIWTRTALMLYGVPGVLVLCYGGGFLAHVLWATRRRKPRAGARKSAAALAANTYWLWIMLLGWSWQGLSCTYATDGLTISPPAGSKVSPSCQEWWTINTSACFRFFPSPETFVDAQASCRQLGADLAWVDSPQENNALAALMPRNAVYWIGLRRLLDGTRFQDDVRWVHDNSIPSTFHVDLGVEMSEGADCIRASNSIWYPDSCDSAYAFICRKAPSTAAPLGQERVAVLLADPNVVCAASDARWTGLLGTAVPGLLLYQLALPLWLVLCAKHDFMAFAAAPYKEEWKRRWLLVEAAHRTALVLAATFLRLGVFTIDPQVLLRTRSLMLLLLIGGYSCLLLSCKPYRPELVRAEDGALFYVLLASELTKLCFAAATLMLQAEGASSRGALAVEAFLLAALALWLAVGLYSLCLYSPVRRLLELCGGGERRGDVEGAAGSEASDHLKRRDLGTFSPGACNAVISAPGAPPRSWEVEVRRPGSKARAARLVGRAGDERPPMLKKDGSTYRVRFLHGDEEADVDGALLAYGGIAEYEFWNQAVNRSCYLHNYSFACVWIPGVKGCACRARSFKDWLQECKDTRGAAKSPDISAELWEKYQASLPWICEQLSLGYGFRSPEPPCDNCAWFDYWAINVMRCHEDGQALRFAFLEDALYEGQPEFRCKASGRAHYVGIAQKVELEWAQDCMGLTLKPVSFRELLRAEDALERVVGGFVGGIVSVTASSGQRLHSDLRGFLRRRHGAQRRRLWNKGIVLTFALLPLFLAVLSCEAAARDPPPMVGRPIPALAGAALLCLAGLLLLRRASLFRGMAALFEAQDRLEEERFCAEMWRRLEARGRKEVESEGEHAEELDLGLL